MARNWWQLSSSQTSGVPFAMDRSGKWQDVDAVARGKECHCFCAECHGALIARQGDVRVHHFAYEDRKECRMAMEASLHGMARQLFVGEGVTLKLPAVYTPTELRKYLTATAAEAERVLATIEANAQAEKTLTSGILGGTSWGGSTTAQFDVLFPSEYLGIHLLSSTKRYEDVVAATRPDKHLAQLGINLKLFGSKWWSACERNAHDFNATPPSASTQLSQWLAQSSEGRGWFYHPLASQIVRDARQKADDRKLSEYYREQSSVWLPTRTPTPPIPSSSVAIPMEDTRDEIVRESVAICTLCGSPCDEIRMGGGYYRGRRAIACRANKKHPLKMNGQ